ncbi:metallophosphoesterase [Ornithinibacillus halophilus]|uniref:Protein phosphatase n=1 Tax=Ornithinibacillus halophilus TaxID=930117 RepID=A0A1M5KD78_9BACI|nr:metallophosphoesterase [Ornithinibacillus halophilus]SHG50143.1 protein phosphatase [Ornithinibacillus halophilus]
MINVQKLSLDNKKRTIIISDIHGNLPLLIELLNKVNYTKEDYLFINGDLCEKGPNSLEVVRYIREIMIESKQVYVNKGNCDILHRYVFEGVDGIRNYMKKQPYSILNDMLREHGKVQEDFLKIEDLAAFYNQHFHEELNWLDSLPIAYETDNHIIIHAGIENRIDWEKTTEENALSMKAFYNQNHQAGKTVVVGHWPVVNYREDLVCSNNPIIDLEKQVIAIDGGNQIKKEGQINALIIEGGDYQFEFVDQLEHECTIHQEHIDTTDRVGTITYPNYELSKIEEDIYFTLCENINLGIQQWVKNEYLIENEQGLYYSKDDLSTTFLSVTKGETVWIVDQDCGGYTLIKKEIGDVGWIPKKCLEKEANS